MAHRHAVRSPAWHDWVLFKYHKAEIKVWAGLSSCLKILKNNLRLQAHVVCWLNSLPVVVLRTGFLAGSQREASLRGHSQFLPLKILYLQSQQQRISFT